MSDRRLRGRTKLQECTGSGDDGCVFLYDDLVEWRLRAECQEDADGEIVGERLLPGPWQLSVYYWLLICEMNWWGAG